MSAVRDGPEMNDAGRRHDRDVRIGQQAGRRGPVMRGQLQQRSGLGDGAEASSDADPIGTHGLARFGFDSTELPVDVRKRGPYDDACRQIHTREIARHRIRHACHGLHLVDSRGQRECPLAEARQRLPIRCRPGAGGMLRHVSKQRLGGRGGQGAVAAERRAHAAENAIARARHVAVVQRPRVGMTKALPTGLSSVQRVVTTLVRV
jgi:hypothetical protein